MNNYQVDEEFDDWTSELCPYCGHESSVLAHKPTPCSFCGEILLPCSMCDLHHICSADTCPY